MNSWVVPDGTMASGYFDIFAIILPVGYWGLREYGYLLILLIF